MTGEITIRSTTDSVEDIKRALGQDAAVVEPDAPGADDDGDGTETPPSDEAPKADAAQPETPKKADAEPSAKPDDKGDKAPDVEKLQRGIDKLQARVDQLVREKSTSERSAREIAAERDRLQAEIASLKAQQAGGDKAPDGAPASAAPAEPKQEDFDSFEEFDEARLRWREDRLAEKIRADLEKTLADQRKADEDARTAAARKAAEDRAQAAYVERMTQAKAKYPDMDEVLAQNQDVPTNPAIDEVIAFSQDGPDILYYLATHPDECEKLSRMPDGPTRFALGQLAAGLRTGSIKQVTARAEAAAAEAPPPDGAEATAEPTAAATTMRAPVSRAPRPITVVGSRGAAPAKDPSKMTMDEYRAWRQEQRRVS